MGGPVGLFLGGEDDNFEGEEERGGEEDIFEGEEERREEGGGEEREGEGSLMTRRGFKKGEKEGDEEGENKRDKDVVVLGIKILLSASYYFFKKIKLKKETMMNNKSF